MNRNTFRSEIVLQFLTGSGLCDLNLTSLDGLRYFRSKNPKCSYMARTSNNDIKSNSQSLNIFTVEDTVDEIIEAQTEFDTIVAFDVDFDFEKIKKQCKRIITNKFIKNSIKFYVAEKQLSFTPIDKSETICIWSKEPTLGISIATKGRTNTSLPLTLQSILVSDLPNNLVKNLVIADTNTEKMELNNLAGSLLLLLEQRGIKIVHVHIPDKNQVYAHENVRENMKTDLCLRLDDDVIIQPNTIRVLYELCKQEGVGGVSCPIMMPMKEYMPAVAPVSSDIEDIFTGLNLQFFAPTSKDIKEVQHMHCSFMYRIAYSEPYEKELSPVGHREESIFTYNIFKNGYKLLITPETVMWHLKQTSGGIRSWTPEQMMEYYKKDNDFFDGWMKRNNIKPRKIKVVNALFGMGDNLMLYKKFKEIYNPEYIWYIATNAMEVWGKVGQDYKNVFCIHPNMAMIMCQNLGIDFISLNPYNNLGNKYGDDYKKFNKHFTETFNEIYEIKEK